MTSGDRLLGHTEKLSLSRRQFCRIRSRRLRRAAWGAVSVVIGLLVLVWALLSSMPARIMPEFPRILLGGQFPSSSLWSTRWSALAALSGS